MFLRISVGSSSFIWNAIKIYLYIEIQCYCLMCKEQNKPKYDEIDQDLFATEGESYPYPIPNNYICRSAKTRRIFFYCITIPPTFPLAQILSGHIALWHRRKPDVLSNPRWRPAATLDFRKLHKLVGNYRMFMCNTSIWNKSMVLESIKTLS